MHARVLNSDAYVAMSVSWTVGASTVVLAIRNLGPGTAYKLGAGARFPSGQTTAQIKDSLAVGDSAVFHITLTPELLKESPQSRRDSPDDPLGHIEFFATYQTALGDRLELVSQGIGGPPRLSRTASDGTAPQLPPVPPGLIEAYANAAKKLEAILKDIDGLDTKLGVVVAGLGIATAAVVRAELSILARGILAVLLAISLICAIVGFLVTKWQDAPYPRTYARWATQPPDQMQARFLPNLLDSYDRNVPRLRAKGYLLNAAAVGVLIAAGLILLGWVLKLQNIGG